MRSLGWESKCSIASQNEFNVPSSAISHPYERHIASLHSLSLSMSRSVAHLLA